MMIEYDAQVDAAYISLSNGEAIVGPVSTYSCDSNEVGGEINLNFDLHGRLVGIEVLQASKKLFASLIDNS
jgi:uncharacterized protein YuzE